MNDRQIPWFGIAIIVVGVAILLTRLHLVDLEFSNVFWPLMMGLAVVNVTRGFAKERRGQIFGGKLMAAVTYAIVAIVLSAGTATVAGCLASGFNPLTSLSGTRVSAGTALGLVGGSVLVYLMPILAVACIGLLLSSVTRNSAAAVVGTLMVSLLIQLVGILPGLGGLHPYLLSTQFNAWQGLLRTPAYWDPILRSVWVCALYGLPALAAAALVFLRRDVAES